MKALVVGAFNQEKALEGAFSVIVKTGCGTDGSICGTNQDFTKNFYEEHPDISGLSRIQVIDLQQKHNVKVSGPSPPRPVSSFGHFGFDEALMKSIRKSEFTQPTPIQVTQFRRRKKIVVNIFSPFSRPRPSPAFSAAVTCLELLKQGRVKRAPSSGRCECLKVLLISA